MVLPPMQLILGRRITLFKKGNTLTLLEMTSCGLVFLHKPSPLDYEQSSCVIG